MTTINEIKDRLNAVAFAGRSYTGMDPRVAAKEYAQAVAAFDQNAAVDMGTLSPVSMSCRTRSPSQLRTSPT